MAFEVFDDPNHDPGTRFVFAKDPSTQEDVAVFVRRVPLDEYRKLAKRYGKEERRDTGDGIEIQRVRSEEEWLAFLTDQASIALASVENLHLKLKDDEAVRSWGQALGAQFSKDQEIDLGQFALNAQAKRKLFSLIPKLAGFVVNKSVDVQKAFAAHEEELSGN
jgi:hypothetical protein